jgi:hypothetical protein
MSMTSTILIAPSPLISSEIAAVGTGVFVLGIFVGVFAGVGLALAFFMAFLYAFRVASLELILQSVSLLWLNQTAANILG